MATTAKGTPYVEASDLVAGYPAVSLDLAEHIDDNVAYNAATINAQTGTTYTFALADATAGKLVTASNASASTYTVPPESSVVWPAGSVLRILNQGAGVVTVAAGSGVTINGTPLTLAQYKGAAIQKTGTDTWTFIPFSGGVGNAAISDTPTGSYTGYQYWTFTASGTLTVTTAGFADVLVVGGGGAGGKGTSGAGAPGGGAGGYLSASNVYLSASTHTVTVGAGGATGVNGFSGNSSYVGPYVAPGGGGGHVDPNAALNGNNGGSGSGGWVNGSSGGLGVTPLGNNGGGSTTGTASGGGGGAGSAGGVAAGGVGGTAGTGAANSITGSSVTYAAGGAGVAAAAGAGSNATANTGNGGPGGGNGSLGGAGGSGIVIVRVAV